MNSELTQLVERARGVEMTPAQLEAQRRSFAHGNAAIDNPRVTRGVIDAAASEPVEGLWPDRPADPVADFERAAAANRERHGFDHWSHPPAERVAPPTLTQLGAVISYGGFYFADGVCARI